MTAPALKLNLQGTDRHSAGQRDVPADLTALLDAADEVAMEKAWVSFVERYSLLLLHAAGSRGRGYDSVMERYTYVLDQLRRENFRRLRRFQPCGQSAFSTWLVVVTRRLCVDFHRQRYGRSNSSKSAGSAREGSSRRYLEDLVSDADVLASIPDLSRGTITSEYNARERHLALERVLETLNTTDRLLLKLRFEEGLTAKQIGHVPGFHSQALVYRRLEALLVSLRAKLELAGIEPLHGS